MYMCRFAARANSGWYSEKMLSKQEREFFRETVWDYYRRHGRHGLSWRGAEADGSFDPYKIMVSEIMLQQTQVSRVLPKFEQFLALFPTVQALAAAPLSDVLVAWNGLGYNRRAKFLWQAAQMVMQEYGGVFPVHVERLHRLPGIGINTAGAILAYSYNQPVAFVETNIRTVYIHHFFANHAEAVHDKTVLGLVQETLDHKNPREWYWALMDYGTHLKQTVGNLSQRSKSYTRQSKFEGSLRQVRGAVIRTLTTGKHTPEQLAAAIADKRLPAVLVGLERENLIQKTNDVYHLPGA
ncbi:MAG TPA: hypothetical protein VJR27_05330 [Candidatus Saccharimonadales bacterium]|nr:hypothetical protein [Candidatus Saccharimonadales bacterium]